MLRGIGDVAQEDDSREMCGPGPQRDDVEAELARLLAAEKIARNVNTARFLRYVVEETLAGRGERLKAFSIATQALGRSDSFDPQSDSIVRVQAVRVRAQLDEYYAGAGAGDPVRITLPKGAYQPKFTFPRLPAPSKSATPASPVAPPLLPLSSPARRTRGWVVAGLALVLLGAIAIAGLTLAPLARGGRPWPDGVPVLSIEARGAPKSGALGVAADRMLNVVETAAAAGEYVRVRRLPEGEAESSADYVLEARFSALGAESFDVAFVLVERRTRDVTWSWMLNDIAAGDRARQESLALNVAASASEVGGALLADLFRRMREGGAPLAGLYCRLTALNYLLVRKEADRLPARRCLETQIVSEPDDARSLTLLSSLLVNGYLEKDPGEKGEIDLQSGLQMARRGYDLAPNSVNALAALFYARFADKRYEDAFAFVARMQEKGAHALFVRLRLGRAFVARARYLEGVAELEALEAQLGAPQPVATAYLALAALMRDDFAALERYEGRVAAKSTPLGLLLGMIACRQRGDGDGVKARRELLEQKFPQVSADFAAAFDRYGLDSAISSRLLREIAALGFAGQD
jgi:hypothetical protein